MSYKLFIPTLIELVKTSNFLCRKHAIECLSSSMEQIDDLDDVPFKDLVMFLTFSFYHVHIMYYFYRYAKSYFKFAMKLKPESAFHVTFVPF